jgi:hypothetical protein
LEVVGRSNKFIDETRPGFRQKGRRPAASATVLFNLADTIRLFDPDQPFLSGRGRI